MVRISALTLQEQGERKRKAVDWSRGQQAAREDFEMKKKMIEVYDKSEGLITGTGV